MKVIGGPYGNALTIPSAVISMSPADDPSFPVAGLFDGPGMMGARFGSSDANPTISIDVVVTREPDGGFGTPPLYWNPLAGTVTSSGTLPFGGAGWSLELIGHAAAHTIQQVTVKAGHPYRLEGWAYCVAGATAAKISVYNPDTGHWLNSAGQWVPAIAYLLSNAAAAWVGIDGAEGAGAGKEFVVEDFLTCLGHTTTLWIELWGIDDLYLYPGVDFLGIFGGHNIPPLAALEWRYEASVGLGAGTVGSAGFMTKAQHQFFKLSDRTIYSAGHLLDFTVPAGRQIYIGDVVIGKTLEIFGGRAPSSPFPITFEEKGQVRLETAGGTRWIRNRGPYPPRQVSMRLEFQSAAEYLDTHEKLFLASGGGAYPAVVLPAPVPTVGADAAEPTLAIYGDITGQVSIGRDHQGSDFRSAEYVVAEGSGFEIR
jgi:hypothetical protein